MENAPKVQNDIELLYDIQLNLNSKKTLEEAAEDMITGVTIGTIQTSEGIYTKKKHCNFGTDPGHGAGEVRAIDRTGEKSGIVKVAYSKELSQIGKIGFAGLMSVAAGDGLGTAYEMEKVRLVDITLPTEVLSELKGPRFGVWNIRQQINLKNMEIPLTAFLLKPNTGQPSNHYAKLSYEAALAGIDYIKEDELQFNHPACPLLERVPKIVRSIESGMEKTGRTIMYAPNVTSGSQLEIINNAKRVVDLGASAIMLNAVQVGLDSLRVLNEANIGVPIHVHRSGHDCFTRGSVGIDLFLLTKLFRLAGADIVHTGPVFGGLYDPNAVVKNIRALTDDWTHLKKCLPVLSRSSTKIVQDSIDYIGTDQKIEHPTNVMFLVDRDVYDRCDHQSNGNIYGPAIRFVEIVRKAKSNRTRFKKEILASQGYH